MSSIIKAIRNLGNFKQTTSVTNNINTLKGVKTEMASQVVLNNGLKFPRIGLGTYGLKDKARCLRIFSEAISCGYRLFDTGTLYGNDEFIGDVVYEKLSNKQVKRDELFIETKIAPWEHGKANTNAAVDNSLKRLKLSYLDLVLVHWPGVAKVPPTDPKNKEMRQETWKALEDLVATGKIKSIGVSNYTENHLRELLEICTVKPTVNQVEFHPLCYQKSLLDFCKTNSIYLQAYSSLGSSQGKPPGWTVLFNNEVVKALASKYNKTIPQILLRWGLQQDCLLIPKTSKVENLSSNMSIFNFELTEEDLNKLSGINQDKHFCWNPNEIL